MIIYEGQSGESAEDEQITNKFIALLLELAVYQLGDFLFGKETSFGGFGADTVCEERVTLQPAVVDGHIDHPFQGHHIRPYRIGAVVFLYAQE